MILNLSGVFAGDQTLPFETELDLSELDFSGTHPFKTPVKVKGCALNRAGVVMLDIEVEFTFTAPCDRCAAEVSRDEKLSLSYVAVQSVEDDETDDFLIAEDMKLDIDPIIRDDIILRVPMKFLCNPDCKGICPKCGKNLNEGPCGCEKEVRDTRLDALKGFFD